MKILVDQENYKEVVFQAEDEAESDILCAMFIAGTKKAEIILENDTGESSYILTLKESMKDVGKRLETLELESMWQGG